MEGKMFRYEVVVQKIEELISSGELAPGDKIPSVRKLSEQLQVSMTTIFQAYDILQDRGMIQPKAKSGYYLTSQIKNSCSATIATKGYIPLPVNVEVNTMATTMMKNSRERGVVNFSILSPVNEFLPISKLNRFVNISLKELSGINFQYPLVEGHPRLLKQINQKTISWPNAVAYNRILITNGAMEAINLCLDAVAKPGDTIAVESPTYHGILQSLESRKLKVLEISTDPETGLNLDELRKAIDKNKINACVFMPRASNPTGASMPEDNKIKLAELLGIKNIPLIEDDSLGELQFSTGSCLPVKAYDTYENVLYCSSFSKTLAPGFRIGWISGGRFHNAIEKLKFGANISTTGIFQDALGRYLETGYYTSHIKKMSIDVQCQVNKYINAIQKYFPDNVKITKPLAGFSLWIELPQGIDSLKLQRQALDIGIGLCPGHIFSMTGLYNNYIRINCCPLWNLKTEKAIEKLGLLMNQAG